MKKFEMLGRKLSKTEQRGIKGGVLLDPVGDGCPASQCVHCYGTGGSCGGYAHSCWCRTDQNPTACNTIYSGCSSVYGELGSCEGCVMN